MRSIILVVTQTQSLRPGIRDSAPVKGKPKIQKLQGLKSPEFTIITKIRTPELLIAFVSLFLQVEPL